MIKVAKRMRRLYQSHCFVSDPGSGTMLAVMLMIVVGVMLGVLATAGNILLRQHQVRAMADISAISAVQALLSFKHDPCAVARHVVEHGGGKLERCTVQGEDVTVRVTRTTNIPFIPTVSYSARAGPVQCQ